MTFRRWTIPAQLTWRSSLHIRLFAIFSFALLLALVGALAAPDAAEASDPLWFKSTKGNWAVTSGVAAAEIGRVRARGVPKTHIRYSVQGADGFSIGRKSGKVSYDGTPISASSVSLTVTARDAKGRAESASTTLQVRVSQQVKPPPPPPPTPTPTPKPTPKCTVGLVLDVGERCIRNAVPMPNPWPATSVEVYIHDDGRPRFVYECFGIARCTLRTVNPSLNKGGLTIEKLQAGWTITAVP